MVTAPNMMSSLLPRRIAGLLPQHKPELWDHGLITLRRRARARLGTAGNAAWSNQPHRVSLAYGDLKMDVVPSKYVHNAIFLYGIHEYPATLFVLHWLRPGATFVDVGANIGYFTLLAAHRVGQGGRVIAFEPLKGLRGQLQAHVQLNHLPNVAVRAEAVSDTLGTATIYETPWDLNEGLGSLMARPEGNGTAHQVPTTTLDALRGGLGSNVLVKVDVEGAEHLVLAGAQQWLRDPLAPTLLFECHQPADTIPQVEAHGYSVFALGLDFMAGLAFYPWHAAGEHQGVAHEAPNFVAVKEAGVGELQRLAAETRWPMRVLR